MTFLQYFLMRLEKAAPTGVLFFIGGSIASGAYVSWNAILTYISFFLLGFVGVTFLISLFTFNKTKQQ